MKDWQAHIFALVQKALFVMVLCFSLIVSQSCPWESRDDGPEVQEGHREMNEVDVVVESKHRCWVWVMWIIIEGWRGELEWCCLDENKIQCVSEAGGVVIIGIVGELR